MVRIEIKRSMALLAFSTLFMFGCATASERLQHDQQNLVGFAVQSPQEITDILAINPNFANAFGFRVESVSQFAEYLVALDNRAKASPGIATIFFRDSGVYDFTDTELVVDLLVQTMKDNNYTLPIMAVLDEFFWHIRMACDFEQKTAACDEIAADYVNTITGFEHFTNVLKSKWHHAQVFHVESYAELVAQLESSSGIKLLYNSDYIGFDCYGDFHDCGILGIPSAGRIDQPAFAQTLFDAARQKTYGAKLVLMPGGFTHSEFFPTEADTIAQLQAYFDLYDTSLFLGGIAVFGTGEWEENGVTFYGALHSPNILQWLENEMSSRLSYN